ncbi:hypothetical protein BU25DRAFT_462506 [Macroventuria anomochaeta]|uniref:Uncharacterized protein n=1 Tax=Macroventuria anomochaeta TaxID=301207 RepID=A0ACB6RLP3_9PLEO|nr:uncharacterized protein BU25DRAFT_462506 [Macroventuria anomochaeta]KAF2622880.1 hypothetical protein BU25DRAFT_462506 [Macroventuria anomochaeta]
MSGWADGTCPPIYLTPSSPHCSVSPPPRPATAPSRRCTLPALPSQPSKGAKKLFLIPFELFSNGSKGLENNAPTPANWILKRDVFPSAYRNAVNQETTSTKVEGEVKLPDHQAHGREGHEETHESFSATVHQQQQQQQPPPRDTHIKEEVRIYEEERRRPQQPHREEVHIHEETRYRQPERAQSQFDRQSQYESRQFDRFPPQPSHSHTHIDIKDSTYDRHFNTVHGPATDYAPTPIDVSERQFRERTRPIVEDSRSGYTRETFTAKHQDTVDRRHPEVRVETSARSTAEPSKHRRLSMGYYDNEGQYHSFRNAAHNAAHKVAHKVAERVAHPIHPHRHHHHSDSHSYVGNKYSDDKEEIIVKEKYTTSAPSHVSAAPSHAPAPSHAAHSHVSAAPAPLPSRPVSSGAPVQRSTRVHPAPAVTPYVPAAPATARKMASANTITIPCHHIRIGDLLILQGRPCQVIRITTSSQTGQHRYLGVDLFTKQLHEESSFISNPAPSVVVQNMLGPVFKQYRVLDIREDGRVVAMTETGDVKQGLPVLDQSGLSSRLAESFDNGRGSVRILVINDDGLEMAVDYKVVHGSKL